jgi:RNA polymerase sigma factor (sigma-70 family)
MRSRDTNLDQFSTFAFLQGDRVRHWLPEPRLRRNMRKHLTEAQAPDEDIPDRTWAIYWYKIWQVQQASPPELNPNIAIGPAVSQRIAQQHLDAYLQEVCYWSAQITALRFPQLEFTLADYFQINSRQTARVLKSFSPQFGSPLKGYASIVLTTLLRDHLRQRRSIDVCNDVSLLRKISWRRITEILTQAGVTANDLAEYQFAWVCFKTIMVPLELPDMDKTYQPKKSLWTAVANLYNSKRHQQLSPAAPQITAEQLEARLMKLTRWSRAYLYPTVDAPTKTKPGQEKGEIQDNLADPLVTSLLEAAIEAETNQERQQQRSQFKTTLTQSLNQLDGMAQEILRLHYQDRLSLQELALNMNMSQPKVCGRLKKAEAVLLTKLLGSMDKIPEPSELKHISIAMKECLESHYRL